MYFYTAFFSMCAHEIGKHAAPAAVSSPSRCAEGTAAIAIALFLPQAQPRSTVTLVGVTSATAAAPNGSHVTQSSQCVSF